MLTALLHSVARTAGPGRDWQRRRLGGRGVGAAVAAGLAVASLAPGGDDAAMVLGRHGWRGTLDHGRRAVALLPRRERNHQQLADELYRDRLMNHLVNGPMRDPSSLNKPSSYPDPGGKMLPMLGESNVHLRACSSGSSPA